MAASEPKSLTLRLAWTRRLGAGRRNGAATFAQQVAPGAALRVRSPRAAALRAVLERHGATVSPGREDGVLLVADLGAARIVQLAAARAIVLDEPPTPSR